MLKDQGAGPLTRKFANGPQAIIEGQEYFTNHGLP